MRKRKKRVCRYIRTYILWRREDEYNAPMIKRQAMMVKGQEAGQARDTYIYNAPNAG